jgi:hypothetical protein
MGPSHLSTSMFLHFEEIGSAVIRRSHIQVMIQTKIWAVYKLPRLKSLVIFVTSRKYTVITSSPASSCPKFLATLGFAFFIIFIYVILFLFILIYSTVHTASPSSLPTNQSIDHSDMTTNITSINAFLQSVHAGTNCLLKCTG